MAESEEELKSLLMKVKEKCEKVGLKLNIQIIEKAREFKQTCISASLTMLKPLTVWITTNCGKFLKNGNTRPPYLSPAKPV